MQHSKSIIDELDNFLSERDKHMVVESRANHIISSAINLLAMIRESFSPEEATELHKKLLVAIKSEDPRKFRNKIRSLKESSTKGKRHEL